LNYEPQNEITNPNNPNLMESKSILSFKMSESTTIIDKDTPLTQVQTSQTLNSIFMQKPKCMPTSSILESHRQKGLNSKYS
jgi:hypothetical protein